MNVVTNDKLVKLGGEGGHDRRGCKGERGVAV